MLIPLVLLTAPASAEDWQYFAVTSDGRYLSDDDTFRVVGTGEHDDYSVDVQIKNFDSGEKFRIAISLTDCLRYGNGALLLVPASGQPQQLAWDAKRHQWLDLAGRKLCEWAKTQATATN